MVTSDESELNGDEMRLFLNAHPTIRFIRLQWFDLSGVVRVRILLSERTINRQRRQ